MPLLTTRAGASSKAYGFGSAASEELGGMVLITPTSIVSAGTGNSSSIGANGSVTFSSCTTLSLNGVFSAAYDNYMIVMRHNSNATGPLMQYRYRASGTDAAGTDYTSQELVAESSAISGARTASSVFGRIAYSASNSRSGTVAYIYGPFLSQPTALYSTTVAGYAGGWLMDKAATHALSLSYDGISFIMNSGTVTGLVSVYGLKGA